MLSPPPPRLSPTAGEGNSALSPLNPGELLIALHNIDSVKCDMKSIIKGEAPSPSPLKWPGLRGLGEEAQSPHMSPLECAKLEMMPPISPIPELQHLPLFLFLPPSFLFYFPSSLHLRN